MALQPRPTVAAGLVPAVALLGALLAGAVLPSGARAAPAGAAVLQPVMLPFVLRDAAGSNWDVQFDGSIGDGGNDLYDGGGRLYINNVQMYVAPNQQALYDAARNEVVFPPMPLAGLQISRRVAVLPQLAACRWVEVLANPNAQSVRVQLRAYFNMGQNVVQAIPLEDEKARRVLGYAIGDPANAVAMVAAGRGSKFQPHVQYGFNNDNVNILMDVDVPARGTVAVVHLQVRRRTAAEAAEAWKGLKDKDLLKDLPADVLKRVINFRGSDALPMDLEVLRGDGVDVVEVRGGDTYHGTLGLGPLRLRTAFGPVAIPPEKVVTVFNVGPYPSTRQVVLTVDGDLFAGRLELTHVPLRMASGQETRIPLAQVVRLGCRKRPADPEEWDFAHQPAAYLVNGDRLRVRAPAAAFDLATPIGPLKMSPGVIASITFEPQGGGERAASPEVRLVDGSRLSALLPVAAFDTALLGPAAGGMRAAIPASAMARFRFNPEMDPEPLAPSITLANQDQLVGTITGTLSLETPFDTLHVEGPQIKRLRHVTGDDAPPSPAGGAGGTGTGGGRRGGGGAAAQAAGGVNDIQVTLWDDSTLSGRLVDSHLTCALRCGVTLRVPIALLELYDQPLPQPSAGMVARIRQVARDLDAGSFQTRQYAQGQLQAIGPAAMSVLRQVRAGSSPEAVRRIDVLLERLGRQLDRMRGTNPGGGGVGVDLDGDGIPDVLPGVMFNGGVLPQFMLNQPPQVFICPAGRG